MTVTPGGNPVCEKCGRWHGLGVEHVCPDLSRVMIFRKSRRLLDSGCIHCGKSRQACEANRDLRDAEHCCWSCEVADRDPH